MARGHHFQSDTPLEKTGVWEGSQHEERGQDKSKTDGVTVSGQDWGPEPGREERQQPGQEDLHFMEKKGC